MTGDDWSGPPGLFAEQAYRLILDRLKADDSEDRLVERRLAEAFSMSRTPVREALRRLTAEGLIRRASGQGYLVRRFVHRDVCDHYDLRMLFEPAAAALSATQPYDEGDERFECLQKTQQSSSFHLSVAATSGSAALVRVIGILIEHPLGRLHSGECSSPTGGGDEGHREILQFIGSHNAPGAADAMKRHLTTLRDCSDRTDSQTPSAFATRRTEAPQSGGGTRSRS